MCGRPGPALACIITILRDFFFLQYKARLFPKKVPVSRVDHILDERIPFNPNWIIIYLDFVAFWVRITGFFRRRYGTARAVDFVKSVERLYTFAAEVYRRNFSTTNRPRHLKGFRFLAIHILDPHLMCIPSLHVMIVIHGWIAFRQTLALRGETELFAAEAEEVRRRALDIAQAVLYVKQHSVNCISAAMYAVSRLEPELFPPEEAEVFAESLFESGGPQTWQPGPDESGRYDETGGPEIKAEDIPAIKNHITGLYRSFVEKGKNAEDWAEPLLEFLKTCPPSESVI